MSALSSLLVRDDIVSIQTIEDALQRQVLEGGDIDTALLELRAAPENVIHSYRAAMFGVPPASREHLMGQQPHVLRAVPRDVAERYRVVPLWIDRDVLVIGVATPPSERVMLELHEALHTRLAIRIAAEVRIEAGLAVHYGVVIPGRLRQLAEDLEKHESGVLRAVAPLRSSTRPPPAPLSSLPPPVVTTIRTQSIGAPVNDLTAPPGEVAPRRPAALIGTVPGGFFEPNTARIGIPKPPDLEAPAPPGIDTSSPDWRKRTLPSGSLAEPGPSSGLSSRPPPPSASVAPATPRVDPDREPSQRVSTRPSSLPPAQSRPSSVPAPSGSPSSAPKPPPPRRARSRSLGSLRGPLTRERADQLLDRAEDRNAIVEVFFAYARQYFDCAAMFSVRDDRVVGLETYGMSGIGDIRAVSLPLEKTGTLDEMVRALLPRIADLARRPADRRLASVLGRMSAQPSALVPITIRQRVVLFLYGDRGGESFDLDELAELVEFVPAVSRAFERVIRASKLLAAGALSATREAEEEAAAANLPPPAPVAVTGPPEAAIAPSMTIRMITPLSPVAPAPIDAEPLPAALIPPDPATQQALSALGVGRQAPPPPSPEAARRASISVSDLETRATQLLRAQTPQPPAPEPLAPPPNMLSRAPAAPAAGQARPSDTYTLLSGKPPDARGGYSLQDAVTDVLNEPRGGSLRPKRGVDAVVSPPASVAPRSPATGASRSVVPKVQTVRPARPDARREGADSGIVSDVVRLPDKPISAPPPRAERASDPPRRSDPGPSVHPPSEPGFELDALLRDLCSSGPDDEAPFVQALLRLGEPVLPTLVARFPGPLWFDRREPFQRLPPGRDVSAVARALYAFGAPAVAAIAPLLSSANPDLRFCALLLVADLNAEGIVGALVPLLSDADAQVKDLARTLLLRLRHLPGFTHVLEELRGAVALDSLQAPTRIDAIQILASLRDARAVDVLILAMAATDHRVASAAHEALRTLTGQDFGATPRKWQSWFAEQGQQPRVLWLIEGLMHADEAVRTVAGNELQRATQQYFGYHPGAAKKDRERVQKKYLAWFEQTHAKG